MPKGPVGWWVLGLLLLSGGGRSGDAPAKWADSFYRWDIVLCETRKDGEVAAELRKVHKGEENILRDELFVEHRKSLKAWEGSPRVGRGEKPPPPALTVIASGLDIQDADRRLRFLKLMIDPAAINEHKLGQAARPKDPARAMRAEERKAIHAAGDQSASLDKPAWIGRAAKGRSLGICIRQAWAFAEGKTLGVPLDKGKACHLDVSVTVANPTSEPHPISLKAAYVSLSRDELGERTGAFEPVWGGAGKRTIPPGETRTFLYSAFGAFEPKDYAKTYHVTLVFEAGKQEEREELIVRASTAMGKPANDPTAR